MHADLAAPDVAPLIASVWPRTPENSHQGVSGNFAEIVSWEVVATASSHWENSVFSCDFAAESAVWLQPDRAGMIDGPNVYQYVRSQPALRADPTGRWINERLSDGLQRQLLYQALATHLGYSLYLELLSSRYEVRFVAPTAMPASFWSAKDVVGKTAWLADQTPSTECYRYVGISVDPVRAARESAPAEATMVHELRHGLDFVNGLGIDETRGYGAGIVAEYELTGDFESALSHARAGAFALADPGYLRSHVFTTQLLDSVQPPP